MKATSKRIKRPREPQVGSKIGRWTVIRFAGWRPRSKRLWLCRCDCDRRTERVVLESSLRSDTSTSCGCKAIEKNTKHGDARDGKRTPEYRTWSSMLDRCTNPNLANYKNYGGRGITVCDRWRTSYKAFLSDMGRRPSKCHSLERIDNNGNYEPKNCEWALPHKQKANRRMTIKVNGTALADLARQYSIPFSTLRFRILKGWDLEDALTRPVRPKRRLIRQSRQHGTC